MSYSIDRSKWNKPHYSGLYDDNAMLYEGIRCKCKTCEQSFIFEPEEQKYQFEEFGRHPFWNPSLCSECQNDWEVIKPKIKEYELSWEQGKIDTDNHEILKKWLFLIKESSKYNKKNYSFREPMIQKLLEHEKT